MSLSTLLSSWAARFSVSSGETAQWPGWIVLIASLGLFALLVYKISLPRPIPGIPHNALAATSILGDIPEMLSHMRETPSGDFVSYISESMFRLNSPLIQVFVRPLSLKGNRPMLVLGDARETQDILLRRSREFDRSPSMGDIVRGIAPSHHIHLRSEDAVFKAQRRLIQDLMTTGFLRDIAGPIIHRSSELLIELWRLKCQAAKERPFEASGDLSSAVIDAITSFAFGNAFRDQHSATRPAIEMMRHYLREKSSNNEAVSTTIHDPQDEPVVFPDGTLDEVLQAILDLRETGGELQGNPFPRLTWAYLMRKPRISNAWRIKEKWFGVELALAADRMQQSEGSIKHNYLALTKLLQVVS
ncbi:hypothetical protein F4778DRAFT_787790 [Xylariomycetidae sp. FL2044]|nr:hypothetical protein F4778DRAFT_787790 [Xylariomycetidae sp. FL2044]